MADIIFNLPNFAAENKFYRSFQKQLDGVTYSFIIQFSARMDRYIMSIGDQVFGIAISAGIDILKQLHRLEVPPGELRTFDYDGLDRDPTRELFGDRITLVYTEAT